MPVSGSKKFVHTAQVAAVSVAVALALASGAVYFDRSRENAALRRQALEVVRNLPNPPDRIIALKHWVYANKGFATNGHYYLLEMLGPTPTQVLQSGGDCADKSRLLSAMLNEIGIPAGLVMLYPCPECTPIHTVVEAGYGPGRRMIVDPIWDIEYPAGRGRYYGVRDLVGTDVARKWLEHLKATSAPSAKIASMPPAEATFDYALGLNWQKNSMTRTAAAVLRHMNLDPISLRRPRILEDPQLALFALLLMSASAFFAIALAVRRWHCRQAAA